MFYLLESEKGYWKNLAQSLVSNSVLPPFDDSNIRRNLIAAFHFYIGTFFLSMERKEPAKEWLKHGAKLETQASLCTYLLDYLDNKGREQSKPATAFEEPDPFVQVSNARILRTAKSRFVSHVADTLSVFKKPVRIMDIGCGDGSLTGQIIENLRFNKKISTVSELLLIEPSQKMLERAEERLKRLPGLISIKPCNERIQKMAPYIKDHYDIVICAISYHHMPYEEKCIHLQELAPFMSNILFLEMDAEHDKPEMNSPELALSVYLSYGRFIEDAISSPFVGAETYEAIDGFLLTEILSTLTEPRGVRTEYHMPKNRWIELLKFSLGPEFSLGCDTFCYSDDHLGFFTLHYGKKVI